MQPNNVVDDDHRDDIVDQIIRNCLDQDNPRSFFLFAGAGSGKTKSLIDALNFFLDKYGHQFMELRRNIAVITYTNAACDEIKRRVQYNPLFQISTLHSFAWTLIQPYTKDIKDFLFTDLSQRIEEYEQKQATGRKNSQAYRDRAHKITAYRERREKLKDIKKFIYNPDGLNTERNSLDHDEVLRICAAFLTTKQTFQDIVVDRFPVLLIDESQDTKKVLMDAFLTLEENHRGKFCLGLLGDVMQRIYLDGKGRIQDCIPTEWAKPCKKMNHRSRKRIVTLCNDIRRPIDGIEQIARQDKPDGIVRLFIIDRNADRILTEQSIQEKMSTCTGDHKWLDSSKNKYLTLEHHMAAKRLGFDDFFAPLYKVSSYKQGVGDGSLSIVSVLSKIIIPLFIAHKENNRFAVMQLIKQYSPLLRESVKRHSFSDVKLKQLHESTGKLLELWNNENDPSCIEILRIVHKEKLFELPSDIEILITRTEEEEQECTEDQLEKIDALEKAMNVPFSHFIKYYEYVSGNEGFDTHQGVKGLQFERVMTIIDDNESQGTTFNYEKLFGITEMSNRDFTNQQQGKETTIDRTRRLLYVTCSRAIDSLAIVLYVDQVDLAYEKVQACGWFKSDEIEKVI